MKELKNTRNKIKEFNKIQDNQRNKKIKQLSKITDIIINIESSVKNNNKLKINLIIQ